jgi:hypothetical protein
MIYSCCNENRKSAVLNNPTAITATPTVDAPGSGYALGDVLTIAESGSSGTATVKVTAISATGGVTAVTLVNNGTNYTTAIGVPTTGGSGSGCTLNIAGTPNGIDYLEVLDHDAIALTGPPDSPRQRTLLIHCLRPVPSTVTRDNIMITGGESITNVTADWVAPANAPPAALTNAKEKAYFTSPADAANVLVVRTSTAGDFSPYTLRLVNGLSQAKQDPFELTAVLNGFDPQLAEVVFSFKVECPPDFDCAPPPLDCPPDLPAPPPINYLAKDYGSFRSIMLDRMSQLLPGWAANTEADLGVALAELIAYVGDRLSYQQDAVATEAYLETARSRISLRRHALLVDYHIHDGANARAWIALTVSGNPGDQIFLDRTATRFYTFAPGMPSDLKVGSNNEEAALISGVQVFEPMWDAILYPEHNQMTFYTWGDTDCCLPKGATEATLYGTFPNLLPGDVLIFQEMVGPQTGEQADADIRHRCAVRLTQVAFQDASGNPLVDPLFEDKTGKPIQSPAQKPTPITEIQWSQDDALRFPLCISSTFVGSNGDKQPLTDVSQAFGNVVLADHGLSFRGKSLGTVPGPQIFFPPDPAADRCQDKLPTPLPVRFRPPIPDSPLTQAVPMAEASIVAIGNPITAGVVSLGGTGFVSLANSSGFDCLTLQATNSTGWPQSFGVVVSANAVHPTNLDLTVVYDPPGGGSGVLKLVTAEKFTDLSLNPADPNYVVAQINGTSKLIQVPGSYTPPLAPPAGFPLTPTMLSNTVPVNLQDTGGPPETYLTLEPANASGWPPLFGVVAQPSANPLFFDLQVVYDPSSGDVGVALPVTLEQFTDLALATAASVINGNSTLITVESFAKTADSSLSAFALMNFDPSQAVPFITLIGTRNTNTETWLPKQDLLESGESDLVFVVEVEWTATLRFGDDTNGRTPESGTIFVANYRIGNGTAGNVGADSLTFKAADSRILTCRNPLPATGGTDPETTDQIRRRAPQAFLTQERAVTMADYAAVTEQNPLVDKAAASLRWTGSWYTVFIAVEPQGAGNLTSTLQQSLKKNVERYHLAGQDLELDSPQYVPLQVDLEICVDPNYFQSDVETALVEVLGSGISPDGQKGLFYPDNFTFGQTVYLSPIYAAARSVAGVVAVRASAFQPQGLPPTTLYLDAGEIQLGPLQIARLANDRSFPNHGQLTLTLEGGK